MKQQLNLLEYFVQALECRLSEIKPALLNGSVWTEAAIKALINFTANFVPLELKVIKK